MRIHIHHTGIALFLVLLLVGCDEGKIYPETREEGAGGSGTVHTLFKGLDAWPQEYMLAFAAFGDNEEMPIVSKIIPKPDSETEVVEVTLSGLDEEVRKLAVVVVNKGRQPIYECYAYPVADASAAVVLPVTEIDLATFDRVHTQVFDAFCIRCHGAGTTAAAGLDLTSTHAPQSLVGIPSTLSATGARLVDPGYPEKSFLVKVLQEDIVRYNHTDVLPEKELISLVKTWIEHSDK